MANVNFDGTRLFKTYEELNKFMEDWAQQTGTVFLKMNSKTIKAARPKRIPRNPALKYM